METFIELLKAVLFGIVEGVTEWLPVSSTGHIILLDEFVKLNISAAFYDLFEIVIQLGAILAVLVLFFHKLNPFSPQKSAEEKTRTWSLWFKVVVAVIPSAVIGLLVDEPLDNFLRGTYLGSASLNAIVVAVALIVYGVGFILVEKRNRSRALSVESVDSLTYRTAIFIGLFQVLSIIPGTSRSGATILGALLLGVGRSAGAEFSFFLAIPTMLGASTLKLLTFDGSPSGTELAVLAVGCLVSFGVSLLAIKGLMEYVRRHSFRAFGVYRIALGLLVLLYFTLRGVL